MKRMWGIALLVGASVSLIVGPQPVRAQACKDEVEMVDGSKQALVSFTDTVKKESFAVFETSDHQKSALNRISMHVGMLGELVTCLDKAAQDTTLTKEDAAAAKTQRDAAAKLLAKIKDQQGAIKNAKTPNDAKTLIGNLDVAP